MSRRKSRKYKGVPEIEWHQENRLRELSAYFAPKCCYREFYMIPKQNTFAAYLEAYKNQSEATAYENDH